MAQIYVLEKASEPKQIQTANGVMTRQSITLREIDGNSQYTPRMVADYIGTEDQRQWVGQVVATCITQRFAHSENGDFTKLQCREVICLSAMKSEK